MKIEDAVLGTSTGAAASFVSYYSHWEKRIFRALNLMVLNGMGALQSLFHESLLRKSPTAKKHVSQHRLFKLNCYLNLPDVVVQPSIAETTKILACMVRSMVDSARPFVRWMDGTCLETPEQQRGGEDEEPYTFSFYNDISGNPQ
jgi:dynein heavy chain